MKRLTLFFLLCLAVSSSFGRMFHISSTGNDALNGLTPGTAWQSLTKVNATTFIAGDSILFKKGDTFYGTLRPAASNIFYGYYGTGANPVITGLASVSAWTSIGTNLWEATVPAGPASLNTVIINGKLTAMGRYPNETAADQGYIEYRSWTTTSVTNAVLTGTPSFGSGELIIRRQCFTTDRVSITGQSGSTINFAASASVFAMRPGFGFYIQNNANCLDVQNEWFYYTSSGTRKLRIFSASNPGTVQVGMIDSLLNLVYTLSTTKSNIVIRGIDFKGSNSTIAKIQYTDNVTIDSCNFSYGGVSGIEYSLSTNLKTQNCSFTDINMCGEYEINQFAVDFRLFKNNRYKRINMNPGMIARISATYPDGNSGAAIVFGSNNVNVTKCVFDSIGYNGVTIRPNVANIRIYHNVLSQFCMSKNDGGAIYFAARPSPLPFNSNVLVDSNVIYNAGAAIGGSGSAFPHVRPVYCDANSINMTVRNNTIFNCNSGIYISQAQYIEVTGNTVYGGGNNATSGSDSWEGMISENNANAGFRQTRFNRVSNNILVATMPKHVFYNIYDMYGGIDSIGIVDSNYLYNQASISARQYNISGTVNGQYNYTQWRTARPVYDAASVYSTDSVFFAYNVTGSTTAAVLPAGSWKTIPANIVNSGTVNVAPFSSVVLVRSVAVTPAPPYNDKLILSGYIIK